MQETRYQQTFLIKGQIVNVLITESDTVSIITTLFLQFKASHRQQVKQVDMAVCSNKNFIYKKKWRDRFASPTIMLMDSCSCNDGYRCHWLLAFFSLVISRFMLLLSCSSTIPQALRVLSFHLGAREKRQNCFLEIKLVTSTHISLQELIT